MKVLSLLQPWATLVVIGAKKIETRGWRPRDEKLITQLKSEGFLIHASKNDFNAKELCGIPGVAPFKDFIRFYTDLPYGAMVGHVKYNDAFETDTNFGKHAIESWNKKNCDIEKEFGDYSDNRYGWLLSDPIKFAIPVKCNGALNLWDCPDNILQQIPEMMTIKR